jgi:Holliday junction resolvase
MPTTPETRLQRSIQKWFTDKGFYVLKIHGNQFQKSGIPDLLIMREGRAFFIEVKTPVGRVSPLQFARMKEIERVASVPCFVVRELKECEAICVEVTGRGASSDPLR